MTVRTWFTISALIMLALFAALVVRLLQPAPAPEIIARVGQVRLDGVLVEACWPQRSGTIVCRDGDAGEQPEVRAVPRRGTLRLAAYPVEPKDGTITISDGSGKRVLRQDWDDSIGYELKPGRYELVTNADYGEGAVVAYRFALSIR